MIDKHCTNKYRVFIVESQVDMMLWNITYIMPRLHLLRSSYDLFVYDFSYYFFGIIGGYKLRRMCLHCLRSPYDFFGDKLGQNLTDTLRILYDNRKVIVQSSCYLHDLPI